MRRGAPLAFPCFEMHANPAVCEVGAGAIVRYGDTKARGHDVKIEATCQPAPSTCYQPVRTC